MRINGDKILVANASTIGAVDATWKTQGVVDVRGVKTLGIFFTLTKNTSIEPMFQVLMNHSRDTRTVTTNDYVLEVPSDYQKVLDVSAATTYVYYEIDVEAVPFVRLQTKATTVSASIATCTIYITKYY